MSGAGMALPQCFDSQTLFTAAGSTTVVITVTAVVQRSLPKLPARWFAFALSLLIALLAISVQGLSWTWVSVVVALVNGVMTYASFMSDIGTLKLRPADWKQLFFPAVHDRPGS